MKKDKKSILVYIALTIFFACFLFMVFYSNRLSIKNSLGASVVPTPVMENDPTLINAAKKMVESNIDNYNGEIIITVKELIRNNYMTGKEINEASKKPYDENIRVFLTVKNKKIEDTYVKNVLFKNVYDCKEVCYLNKDNYIAFNNDIYQIVKIDQDGYIYISNNESKNIDSSSIDSELQNMYNGVDKTISSNVVSVTSDDVKKSNVFKLEDDVFISANSGYKVYNSITEETNDIRQNQRANLVPIIVLNNDLTYMMGSGTKFSPYVLSE